MCAFQATVETLNLGARLSINGFCEASGGGVQKERVPRMPWALDIAAPTVHSGNSDPPLGTG